MLFEDTTLFFPVSDRVNTPSVPISTSVCFKFSSQFPLFLQKQTSELETEVIIKEKNELFEKPQCKQKCFSIMENYFLVDDNFRENCCFCARNGML